MTADPKPHQVGTPFHRYCPEVEADTHGPEPARFLEMERRVLWVPLEQRETPVSQLLNVGREPLVKAPEFQVGAVSHRSRQRPSSRSLNASSPRASRRPAATSA